MYSPVSVGNGLGMGDQRQRPEFSRDPENPLRATRRTTARRSRRIGAACPMVTLLLVLAGLASYWWGTRASESGGRAPGKPRAELPIEMEWQAPDAKSSDPPTPSLATSSSSSSLMPHSTARCPASPANNASSSAPPELENSDRVATGFTVLFSMSYDHRYTADDVQELAARLHRSGVTRHSNFYEFLVCSPQEKTDNLHMEEHIRQAWAAEEEKIRTTCPECLCWGGADAPSYQPARVRVIHVGSSPGPLRSPHPSASKLLLQCVMAVKSAFFLLQTPEWVPISLQTAIAGSGTAPREFSGTPYPIQMISVALQALSLNKAVQDPVLMDLQRPGNVEQAHVFKLQAYTNTLQESAEVNRAMSMRLRHFVATKLESNQTTLNLTTVPPLPKSDPAAPISVVGTFPEPHYGRHPFYHCHSAPLYSLQHALPSFMHPTHAMAGAGAGSTATGTAVTLCEILISGKSGMRQAYAAPELVFYEQFCQEWRKLVSPLRKESDVHREGVWDPQANRDEMDVSSGVCAYEWLRVLKLEEIAASRRGPSSSANAPTPAEGVPDVLRYFARAVFDTERLLAQGDIFTGSLIAMTEGDTERESFMGSRTALRTRISNTTLKAVMWNTVRTAHAERFRGTMEVVCVPSSDAAWTLSPAMYRTNWFVQDMLLRCFKRGDMCLERRDGHLSRAMWRLQRFFSLSRSWATGKYKVCFAGGVYMYAPHGSIPG